MAADQTRKGLHSIGPPRGATTARKRIGRGEGSGYGKTAGRGSKGAGARSGAKRKAGYEGGQNPIHMRMRKLRGPHMKKSMPFEPFRTRSQPVNLSDLNRFADGDEVNPDQLKAKGLATRKHLPVKILGKGKLERKLSVSAHSFSAKAREQIESAGGSCTVIEEAKRGSS
jgi:large subunit ribosomal protein L15